MSEARPKRSNRLAPIRTIAEHPIAALLPYAGNPRTHCKRQIRQIADCIKRLGFTNPVLVADDNTILAGHGRVAAARHLGMTHVPTVRLSHLTPAERRAYVIADNKLALNAGWDQDLLAIELRALVDLEFDIELTGFSLAEVDLVFDAASERSVPGPSGPADSVPPLPTKAVSRRGDLWQCGRHRVICGDAREAAGYSALLDGDLVDLIFTDPPYNVPIDGHACGLGRVRHRDFAMEVGEMSEDAFTALFTETLGLAAKACRDGAIAFVCMDWRHMGELLAAGRRVFSELKNLCVWNKTNAGIGTFYRSKYELVFVFKIGAGPHVNCFGL